MGNFFKDTIFFIWVIGVFILFILGEVFIGICSIVLLIVSKGLLHETHNSTFL